MWQKNNQTNLKVVRAATEGSFMVTRKAKLFQKLKEVNIPVVSNFDLLKEEIKNLQNSQFLNFKLKNRQNQENIPLVQKQYIVNNQFAACKQMSVLGRYKLSLRQKKKRKSSLNIPFTTVRYPKKIESMCISLMKNMSISSKKQQYHLNNFQIMQKNKKRDTPSVIKKYYRPQTCSNRRVKIDDDQQIRGKRINSSVSQRNLSDNVIIACY